MQSGGGVAIYTRDILNVLEMSSFVPENIEAVRLEIIKPKTQPILITTVTFIVLQALTIISWTIQKIIYMYWMAKTKK